MRSNRFSIGLALVLAVVAATLLITGTHAAAQTQTETVLYSFSTNSQDGVLPFGGLVMDATGNLYGVTSIGGVYGGGTAFELSPASGGRWSETILHAFGNVLDGQDEHSSMIIDARGNLYGTAQKGGVFGGTDSFGMAFELSPQGDATWSETVLHSFGATATDGRTPWGGLVADSAGNLYGTTNEGGVNGAGEVYKLSPKSGGGWVEQIIHNSGSMDLFPVGSMIFDSGGNLYGITPQGGVAGVGAVFELKATAKGSWNLAVLHSFNKTDGWDPYASLIMDSAGNLYGATNNGGSGTCQYGCGVVYQLTRGANGKWTEKILHQFQNDGKDGVNPFGKLVMDATGNLYGTTFYGGRSVCGGGCGVVYELSPSSGGRWTEKIVYSFGANGTDGTNPYAELLLDGAGNLYGTTYLGGTLGWGTVFEITP